MEPLLLRSSLTGNVYVVTEYKRVNGIIESMTKHDVTEQFARLMREVVEVGRP